jgi:hypothetical protein
MQSSLALVDMRSFLSTHMAIVPLGIGALVAASLVVFRGSLATFRPFGPSESESVMNFSKNGTLRCICGAEHSSVDFPDRRQFCRSCGCEVVEQDRSLLNKQLSKQEIKVMTRSLRRAAIRASHLELPPSITSIHELHQYLKSDEPKDTRTPPTRPTTLKQPQVH